MKDNINQVLDMESISLESFFRTRLIEANYLAKNGLVQDVLLDYILNSKIDPKYRTTYTLLNDEFTIMEKESDELRDIFILNTKGVAISSNNSKALWLDLSDRKYFHDALDGRTTISNLLVDRVNGESVLFVSTPIYRENTKEIIGVMANIIDPKNASDSIRNLVKQDIGDAYLIDNDSQIIFHTNKNLIGTRHPSVAVNQYFQQKNLNHTDVQEFEYFAGKYYIASQQIKGTPWRLVIEQNISTIKKASDRATYVMLIIALITLVITTMITYFYSKTITTPITQLSKIMSKTALGDLTIHSDYVKSDELGILSKNFNIMIDKLTLAYTDIESKNEELAATEEELRVNFEHLIESNAKIQNLAFINQLTQLPNRLSYWQDITTQIEENQSTKGSFTLLQLDIDNFMRINNTLGHSIGNALLKSFALRLKQLVSPTLKVYHLSEDEFSILLLDVGSECEIQKQVIHVFDLLNQPFFLNNRSIHIGVSIGISIYPNDGESVDILFQNADTAMFEVKQTGKNNYSYYKKVMSEFVQKKIEIESILRRAISDHLISIHFQPQIDIKNNKINGFEALMRITLENGKRISPLDFIPIAEETGMIIPLGEWVLSEAAKTCRHLLDLGCDFEQISVNVSSIQLKQVGFSNLIDDIVLQAGILRSNLELEVTESVLFNAVNQNDDELFKLSQLGYKIALDDFGTGYSSFNYLRTMPLSKLKIDKSFIDHLDTSRRDQDLIRQMIDMSHDLNLTVIAEGVETQSQYSILAEKACDFIQGYYFSRPLPYEELVLFIK